MEKAGIGGGIRLDFGVEEGVGGAMSTTAFNSGGGTVLSSSERLRSSTHCEQVHEESCDKLEREGNLLASLISKSGGGVGERVAEDIFLILEKLKGKMR